MSTNKYSKSFAPYTPPPDDPSHASSSTNSINKPATTRGWFPSQHVASYQSGGLPSFNNSQAGGSGAAEEAQESSGANAWETRFGMRVDVLAAFAYILGPLSALLLLILETHNDYVRFHAYQSALLSAPLLLIRAFASLVGLPQFLRTLLTFCIVVSLLLMAWKAYIDAARNGLARFQLPIVGPRAERWVSEE